MSKQKKSVAAPRKTKYKRGQGSLFAPKASESAPKPRHEVEEKRAKPAAGPAGKGSEAVEKVSAATSSPAKKPSTQRRTAEQMASMQREISVSEFFTKNRHLLGFDNPRKAILTGVKEAVDNSLDACEEAGFPPDLRVIIEQVQGEEDRFRMIVEDNGPGIVPEQAPRIFGKLLYGSKFHRMKMSRGQQGIGISAAGMYGQLTTGKPTRIVSRTSAKKPAHFVELLLDTAKNEPSVIRSGECDWDKDHGTRVEIEMEAKYTRGRQSVEEYLQQVAIANPHASISFEPPEGEPLQLDRSTKDLPPEPREIKPHPYGIELGMLISMLQTTRAKSLASFLQQDFSRVGGGTAKGICERAKLAPNARPSRIVREEADVLYKALQATKLMKPPVDCVVPIGSDLLLKGLKRGVEADFYHTVTRPPSVYRGNPFQVEVGVAFGGSLPAEESARVLRFANRVPLLYQQSACAMTRAVGTTAWKNYGISQSTGQLPVGPLAVAVHIASVWVPFTSESKEAIAHYPEILKEIKLALQECGRKLGQFVRHRRRAADAERKRQYIEKYIPHIGIALREILEFPESREQKIVAKLKDTLERSRKM